MAAKKVALASPHWAAMLMVLELVATVWYINPAVTVAARYHEREWAGAFYGPKSMRSADEAAGVMYQGFLSVTSVDKVLDSLDTNPEMTARATAIRECVFSACQRLIWTLWWAAAMSLIYLAVIFDARQVKNVRHWYFDSSNPILLNLAKRGLAGEIKYAMVLSLYPFALPPFILPLPLLFGAVALHIALTNTQKV